jgi:Na+/proline symporter
LASGLASSRIRPTIFSLAGNDFRGGLIAISCIATLVGSYSLIQYSEVGFNFGMSSLVPYTNEWFVMPLFLLGWLPIVYFGRLQSVPEYFEKRFDRRTRLTVLVMLLIYLEGYIGINLLTIGRIMDGFLTHTG